MFTIVITVIVSWHRHMSAYHTVCFKYMYLIIYQYTLEGLMLKLKLQYFGHLMQMSKLFVSGGQSTGVSASTSVLAMNIQD